MYKKLMTIGFTVLEWLCVFIAAGFALQEPSSNIYIDAFGAIDYLILAGVFEWFKHKLNEP